MKISIIRQVESSIIKEEITIANSEITKQINLIFKANNLNKPTALAALEKFDIIEIDHTTNKCRGIGKVIHSAVEVDTTVPVIREDIKHPFRHTIPINSEILSKFNTLNEKEKLIQTLVEAILPKLGDKKKTSFGELPQIQEFDYKEEPFKVVLGTELPKIAKAAEEFAEILKELGVDKEDLADIKLLAVVGTNIFKEIILENLNNITEEAMAEVEEEKELVKIAKNLNVGEKDLDIGEEELANIVKELIEEVFSNISEELVKEEAFSNISEELAEEKLANITKEAEPVVKEGKKEKKTSVKDRFKKLIGLKIKPKEFFETDMPQKLTLERRTQSEKTFTPTVRRSISPNSPPTSPKSIIRDKTRYPAPEPKIPVLQRTQSELNLTGNKTHSSRRLSQIIYPPTTLSSPTSTPKKPSPTTSPQPVHRTTSLAPKPVGRPTSPTSNLDFKEERDDDIAKPNELLPAKQVELASMKARFMELKTTVNNEQYEEKMALAMKISKLSAEIERIILGELNTY